MPVTEFYEKNKKMQQIVQEEIQKATDGITERNIYQLQTILRELRMMEVQHKIVPSYPHFIVDSWDYSDQLGKELMDIAALYRK